MMKIKRLTIIILLLLNALCACELCADDSALKVIFIYDPLSGMDSDSQQDADSEIRGYKECSIWICVINQSKSNVKFPTAINSHTIRAGTEVRLFITDTNNPIGLHSVKPISELKIVDLRPRELCIFKYKYDVSLKVDSIATAPAVLEVSKEIGQRYDCWSGTLSGKFQEATIKLYSKIKEAVGKP